MTPTESTDYKKSVETLGFTGENVEESRTALVKAKKDNEDAENAFLAAKTAHLDFVNSIK